MCCIVLLVDGHIKTHQRYLQQILISFFFPDYYISLFIRTHSRPGGRKFAFFDTQGLGFPRPTRTVDGGAGLVAYGIWTHMVAVDDVCQDKQVGLQH